MFPDNTLFKTKFQTMINLNRSALTTKFKHALYEKEFDLNDRCSILLFKV